jgi:hypothetical protein
MDFDYETIEQKMRSLPKELQRAMVSVETTSLLQEISDSNNLMIDQLGLLEEITSLTILGLIPVSKFTSNIKEKLGIDVDLAEKIAGEVNEKIFKGIRSALQSIQLKDAAEKQSIEKPQTPPPTIESVGKFTIEKPPVGIGITVTVKKEEVLKEIEDPEKLLEAPSIDHILTTPVVSVEKVEVKKVDVAPVEKKPYTLDPYREQI